MDRIDRGERSRNTPDSVQHFDERIVSDHQHRQRGEHQGEEDMKSIRKYEIRMSDEERRRLVELTRRGRAPARMIARANILLLADKGWSDENIVDVLHISLPTVGRVRKRYRLEGLESALSEKPRPGARQKITSNDIAIVQAVLRTPPPYGLKKWSLRLLADRLVELQVVRSISHETIRSLLKRFGGDGVGSDKS